MMQADTSKAMTHCKYCGKPYAWDGKATSCNCGLTPLNLFHYHQIVERLDRIETLLKGKNETNN